MPRATQRAWLALVGRPRCRSPDGPVQGTGDQIGMPSGIACAVAARRCHRLIPPASPGSMFERGLARLSGERCSRPPRGPGQPSIVLLSEGEAAAAWYGHARIARELSVLWSRRMRSVGRRRNDSPRIDGRRIEVDVVCGGRRGSVADPGGQPAVVGGLLLRPCREGRISCVNPPAPGSGTTNSSTPTSRR